MPGNDAGAKRAQAIKKIDTMPAIPVALSETTKMQEKRPPGSQRIASAPAITQSDFYNVVRGEGNVAQKPMAEDEITKNYTRGVSPRRERAGKNPDGIAPADPYYSKRQHLLSHQLDNRDMVKNMGWNLSNDPRPDGKGISIIVYHWTGSSQAQDAYNEFENFKCKITDKKTGKSADALNNGAHYLILPDGKVQELAPPTTVVNGAKYFNEIAINVEIVAQDEAHITPAQKLAASRLGAHLMEVYPGIKYVAGHCELYVKSLAFSGLLGKDRNAKLKDLKNIGKPDPGEGTMRDIRAGILSINPRLAMITTRAEQEKLLAYSQPGIAGTRFKQ